MLLKAIDMVEKALEYDEPYTIQDICLRLKEQLTTMEKNSNIGIQSFEANFKANK